MDIYIKSALIRSFGHSPSESMLPTVALPFGSGQEETTQIQVLQIIELIIYNNSRVRRQRSKSTT